MNVKVDPFTPSTYEFSTTGKNGFQYKPIKSGTINFTVQATFDASISLAADPSLSDQGYEVEIGGSKNTTTTIRRLEDEIDRVKAKTPDVLNNSKPVGFWVSWNAGNIAVGLKNNMKEILRWKDPDPVLITHYAVRTGCCNEGEWVIEDFWKIKTEVKCTYCYHPMLWGSMKAIINAPHDANIELTSNPEEAEGFYHINVGIDGNDGCKIFIKDDTSCQSYAKTPKILSPDLTIYVTWFNGIVRALSDDKQLIIAWEDPNPFAISTFGVGTSHDAVGHFTVQASLNHFTEFPDPVIPKYYIHTPDQLKYHFKEFSAGTINFAVKLQNDGNIKLSDDPFSQDDCYWISLGNYKNTISTIRKGNDNTPMVEVKAPGICGVDEYREFWISWNETSVAVGKKGNDWPFMRWRNPPLIKVVWYAVMTGWDSTGEWLIEGFQKIATPSDSSLYKLYPITWGNLHVGIKAPTDAHIAIASIHPDKDPVYQIILGCNDNTRSEISYSWTTLKKAHVSTPGILVDGQTAYFLITWINGEVVVFTHDEKTCSNQLLLAWKDTNQPFGTHNFGVSTSNKTEGDFIISGPSLSRLTISESLPTSEKYDFKTPAKLDYQYKPIMNGSINFTIKASGDASIALTNQPNEEAYVYEVTLRSIPNQYTVIRHGENQQIKAAVETVGILSGDEPKGFWIRWYNGCIEAGQKGHNLPIVRWTDPEPVSVTHYAVSTGGNFYGAWLIEDVWDIKTQSSSEYDFKPILWGFLKVSIKAESQARVEITPDSTQKDKCYQIIFGNDNNNRCTILYGQKDIKADILTVNVIKASAPKIFYISWFDGCINVFTEHKNLLVASEDTTAQLAFSLIGVTTEVCTGEFSVWPSLDHVTITEPSIMRESRLFTSAKYRPIKSRINHGSINFSVRASESASVQLYFYSEGIKLGYEVTLGQKKNTESIIKSIDSENPYKAVMETKDILSEDESREFWIKWFDGNITVGKKGKLTPLFHLVDWDWIGISPTHYEVDTPDGIPGAWLIEGIVEVVTPETATSDKRIRPILWGRLLLGIKASKQARISLPNHAKGIAETLYLIIIGGLKNTQTEILCGKRGLLTASTYTPDILSPKKIEEFDITWFNGWVNLLHHNRVVTTWKDPKPFTISEVGFSSLTEDYSIFNYYASLDHITPSEDICTPNEYSYIVQGKKEYHYRPIVCGSINFTVKASSDAQIALTDDPSNTESRYEIIIGTNSNRKTEIRKGKHKKNAFAITPDILSGDEHRGFWIRWNNGTIAVGEKGKLMPIVQWADPEPSPVVISQYGLCTKTEHSCEWKIEDRWEFETKDDSEYSFHPIVWGYAEVVVNSKHDGLFALSTKDGDSNLKYQMQLGSFGNVRCHISIGPGDGGTMATVDTPNFLKEGINRPFLLVWCAGTFFAFDEKRNLVVASEDAYQPAMCYFGASSYPGAFGYFTAKPSLDYYVYPDSFSTSSERQQYEIDTSAGGKYQFKPITSGRVNFAVKAYNDVNLVLTNDPTEENNRFWVVIGGWRNTGSTIRLGRDFGKDHAAVKTMGILSGDEFRGFWLSWNDGSVSVGRKGSVVPFMRWVYGKTFEIRYCGIFTCEGVHGEWVIEGFQKFQTTSGDPWTYFPIEWGALDVTIVAPRDGHIALSSGSTESAQMYQILIGIHNNQISEICYGNRNSIEVRVDTPDILSKEKEKKFLITWFNGSVTVLFEGRALLSWQDPNPLFPIGYFGVCTSSDVVGHFSVRPSLESFTPSESIKETKFMLPIPAESIKETNIILPCPVTETYVFEPITYGSIHFSVKASSEAHVALAEGTGDDCHLKYEIIFGANDNEKTVIRKHYKASKRRDKAWATTKDILKLSEHRGFWVRWNNGVVAAGKKGSEIPFLQWVDTETDSVTAVVTHYAVGGGASGEDVEWLIEDTIPVPNTEVGNYVYEPIVWGRLDVKVKAPHDGRIVLKTNSKNGKNVFTIALGTHSNEKSSISYGDGEGTLETEVSTPSLLSEEKYTPFVIAWFNGIISVYFNNKLLLSWENYDQVEGISVFGVGVWEGAQGLFTVTASLDHAHQQDPKFVDKMEHQFKAPAKFEYQFKRIDSGAINFTLKTRPEAHIALSNYAYKIHSIYKVTFGQNSKWTSISKKGLGEQAKVATPGILSDKDSRGFWISWHDGTIDVGQKGSNRPLVRWTDPEPEYITHYAVCTLGSVGNWVIEDFWKITTYPKCKYGYRGIKWGSMDVIVNASHDAHIALTTAPTETIRMYHIVLGTNDNSKCEIRFGPKQEKKVSVNSQNILSKGKDKSFRITWFNGDVEVYSCQKIMTDSLKLLMKWTDNDSFLINHFGVSTGADSEGSFTVYPTLEHIKMTDDGLESRKKKTVETVNISEEANMVRNVSEVEI